MREGISKRASDSALKRGSNSLIILDFRLPHLATSLKCCIRESLFCVRACVNVCVCVCQDSNNTRSGVVKSYKPPSSICISCLQPLCNYLFLSFFPLHRLNTVSKKLLGRKEKLISIFNNRLFTLGSLHWVQLSMLYCFVCDFK